MMIDKKFISLIIRNIDDPELVNRIVVTAFLSKIGFQNVKNKAIKRLLLAPGHELFREATDLEFAFGFDELIEAFEIAVPSNEKQVNGAVYTPNRIKNYIVQRALSKTKISWKSLIAVDISCGCGAFLFTLAKALKSGTKKTYSDIFKDQLYGLDISKNSIERAQILLSLLAISEGEDQNSLDFNLFVQNALDFQWSNIPEVSQKKGFDLIVGNPPYVRARNLDIESKKLLRNWQVTKTGNPDLYIPFFEIGVSNLNENGILGYITVNTFFKSVNARSLRKYFAEEKLSLEIFNFAHEQVFENKLTYTCLCFISRDQSTELKYIKANSHHLDVETLVNFETQNYDMLDHFRGWYLNGARSLANIQRIEKMGTPLGELFPIKNGIATLSNATYIFKPIKEHKDCYELEKNGNRYLIEKAICRDIIKPNILKFEHEIPQKREKIIFPYTAPHTELIHPADFAAMFPLAYEYLLTQKDILDKRDKGNGDYKNWYAYGRTQALNDKGIKLLFPYMAKRPYFVFTSEKEMLIYCGYAIFSENAEELHVLKRILESSVFEYYMTQTSKPYASGYYSFAKNYVKHFGVCDLSQNEKEEFIGLTSKEEIDSFLLEKYELVF